MRKAYITKKKILILAKTVGIFKIIYLLLMFGVWYIPVHTRNSKT